MMRTLRNVIGAILALAGATAAVWSPFRVWYDGRHGRDYRIGELFSGSGVTEAGAQLFGSLFLPFAFAALVTLVGLLLRSRLMVALAGVIVLGFTVLWMVRVGQAEGSLSVDGSGRGLGAGAGYALAGGVLLLLAALVLAGRLPRARRGRTSAHEPEPHPYAGEPGPRPYAPEPEDTHSYPPDAYPQGQEAPAGHQGGPYGREAAPGGVGRDGAREPDRAFDPDATRSYDSPHDTPPYGSGPYGPGQDPDSPGPGPTSRNPSP